MSVICLKATFNVIDFGTNHNDILLMINSNLKRLFQLRFDGQNAAISRKR